MPVRLLGEAADVFPALSSARRYVDTVRHLRFAQVLSQLAGHLPRLRLTSRSASAVREVNGPWQPVPAREPSLYGPARFRFLNRMADLPLLEDWTRTDLPPLWMYNAHYFDDLNAEGAPTREAWHRRLIARWIAENPPGLGPGWAPYPTSLRIVNWVKWSLAGNDLGEEALASLAAQAAWLEHSVEHRLLANHIFANAVALVFAGAFFRSGAARRWLAAGSRLLSRQAPQQILPDGGHYERSPMYHAIVLESMLDILNLARAYPGVVPETLVAALRERAGRMLGWLDAMVHPDGEIALLNDAALGVSPHPSALRYYAARLGLTGRPAQVSESAGLRLRALDSTGYLRLDSPDYCLIFDGGAIGPDYQPGHAHADTLSFELSHRGRRLFVDSGTSTYDAGPERERQRGTLAHNTLCVDGQDQSEVWKSFRVARRARVRQLAWSESESGFTVVAEHDGYGRLPQPVLHRRAIQAARHSLRLEDSLRGAGFHIVESRLHLHPAFRARRVSSHAFRIDDESGRPAAFVELDPALESQVISTTYHPEFGRSLPNACISACWAGMCPASFSTRIELL